jgi:UDP-N-acetylmuramoyl-tripeptide--D-alanyl-D-alanine ligase
MAIGGAHNVINAAGVFALCRRLGMNERGILDALATYRLPDLRMHVHDIAGFTVVDDCYNANPTSMAAAIDQLAAVRGSRRVLVVGEMAELGDDADDLHRVAGIRAARAGIDVIVSVGHVARLISEAAAGESRNVRTRHYADATAAADGLRGLLATGDTVLIKGSRSARLERIVQQWRATYAEAAMAAQ